MPRAQHTFHEESATRGLAQAHDNSAACNIELRVTQAGSTPMTVRSATLLRPAYSAMRLAHLQDFREWSNPSNPIAAALRLLVQCRPAQRDHLIQPVIGRQVAAILMPAIQFKSVHLEGGCSY
jgi:hypothetical protein